MKTNPSQRRRVEGGPSPRGASFKGNLLRCPQRFAFDHLVDPRDAFPLGPPDMPDPLFIGIEVHEALAHYFVRKLDPDTSWERPERFLTREESINAYEQTLLSIPSWLFEAKVLGVEALGELWISRTGRIVPPPPDAAKRHKWAKKKKPFKNAPYLHTHRSDLEVELADGRVRIIDWKTCWSTSQRAKEDKSQGFDGNLQFCGLDAYGRRKYGKRYDGVWVVLAPKAKQRKPRAGLLEVTPALAARLRWARSVAWAELLYRNLSKRYPDPMQWPATLSEQGPCKDRYGTCPYFAPCRGTNPTRGA